MKAVVNDKKHLTLVSHTNGVVIVKESGCIIDLDFQLLASICEIADLGNICTIKDCDEIESVETFKNEILSLLFGISIIYYYTCIRIIKFKIMYDEGVEFPICGLVADIDYLDCEMANNWNTGNTLSEDNIDLDLDITHIEN